MQKTVNRHLNMLVSVVLVGILFIVLWYISIQNYLFFHTIIESALITVGMVIYIIAINTYSRAKNSYLLFLGISFFSVSAIEFFHTITYRGMGVLSDTNSNVPTQFWVASHIILALAFLIAPFFVNRRISRLQWYVIAMANMLLTLGLLLSILYFKNFPACYIDGVGLTTFKIMAEYAICAVLLGSLIHLYWVRHKMDPQVYVSVSMATLLLILSEISFTQYVSVYGGFNMYGHFLFFLATFFIFKTFILKTLREPYALLYRELKEVNDRLVIQSETDGLTGLHNRTRVMERIEEQFKIAKRYERAFSVIMIDLDDFKSINDQHGHLAGDSVLKNFAHILKKQFRETDIIGRFGGDEFIVCPIEADVKVASAILEDVMDEVGTTAFMHRQKQAIRYNISAGICALTNQEDYEEVINCADHALLHRKRQGKGGLKVYDQMAKKALGASD